MGTGSVTVVVPTRNRARWLRSCLASVLAQTHPRLEVVVADNASTDDTADVVAAFDDPRVRYLRRPTDLGLIESFARAAAGVDSDHLLLLGDDDLLTTPDVVATLVAVLDANPSVGMVHSGFDLIGEDGGVLRRDVDWTDGLTADTVEPGRVFLERTMRSSCRVCSSTALVRADVGEAAGWFRPADLPPIDLGMWLRLSLLADVAFVHRSLVSYRIHGTSHSAALGPVVEDGYVLGPELIDRVHEVKLAFLEEHRAEVPDAGRLRRLAARRRRQELLTYARRCTLPERRFGPTARTLALVGRRAPGLLLDGGAWKLLAGSAIGPTLVERLRGTPDGAGVGGS